jgi:membrane-bound lytic murein transglycosylase D
MKLCLSSLIACFLFVSSSFAAEPNLPSTGLEQRIDFWKKIYTQYGKDDVVIHDLFHVNLIYDVASDSDVKVKVIAIKDALRDIKANLGLENLDNLDPTARQVYTAIAGQNLPMTAATIDYLVASIHTQRGIKERFRDGVVRSGRYVEEFREILQKQGVPADLALLPLVESSFENVRSKAGAVGIWQFMRSTGRLYMKVGTKNDERLNPTKATQAAARLLSDNYKALGEWPLAITAYNHGRGGMLRAQKQHGSDLPTIINDYKGPVFGYASMNFYSEFLAAVEIYNSYSTHFGDLVLDRPNTPVAKPAAPKVAAVKAPAKAPAKPAAATTEKYKVRSGDTLFEIAQKFGTTIRNLMEMNNLNKTAIHAGQILLVK